MSVASIAAVVLLTAAVLVDVLAVLGAVVMPTALARLHFVGPAACVAPVLMGIAVAAGTHATPSLAGKGLVVAFILALFSGVLTHETGRAVAAREGLADEC